MFQWIATALIAALFTLGGYIFSTTTTAQEAHLIALDAHTLATRERLATLEAHRASDSARLERIEEKLDQLIGNTRRPTR